MISSKKDLCSYIERDLSNYSLKGIKNRIKNILLSNPASSQIYQWRYLYYLRKAEYAINSHKKLKKIIYLSFLRHYGYKTGFQIPPNVLGPGVTFYHWGMIIIHESAKIGKNATFQPKNR